MNIGLIGAGAIANFLLTEINQKQMDDLQIKSVFVRDRKKYKSLELKYNARLFTDLEAFLASGVDTVVEAATIEAVHEHLPTVLKEKDAVLISIGALADETFLQKVSDLVEIHKHSLYLPSGAIGGLDLLQNAHALGTVKEVSLTTRKPADSLVDSPINIEEIVFEGKATDAIKQFPKNINVSIILSLAGIGLDKTKVTIIADPKTDKNSHHIEVQGDFGTAALTVDNAPLPENPKTSYLAAMAVLGTLKRIGGRIRIG